MHIFSMTDMILYDPYGPKEFLRAKSRMRLIDLYDSVLLIGKGTSMRWNKLIQR